MSHLTVDHEPGFVLSTRDWKESSLLIDVFTQHFGRKRLIARGVRRPTSASRGLIVPFVPLSFSWFGQRSYLHQVKWVGGYPMPSGIAMLSAWYVNELLLKLLPLCDPYPTLFDRLQHTMQILATGKHLASTLRKFEYHLLLELGLAPSLEKDAQDKAILADQMYWVQHEQNLIRLEKATKNSVDLQISGQSLLNIHKEQYVDDRTKQEARAFFQFLLTFYLPKNQINMSEMLHQLAHLSS